MTNHSLTTMIPDLAQYIVHWSEEIKKPILITDEWFQGLLDDANVDMRALDGYWKNVDGNTTLDIERLRQLRNLSYHVDTNDRTATTPRVREFFSRQSDIVRANKDLIRKSEEDKSEDDGRPITTREDATKPVVAGLLYGNLLDEKHSISPDALEGLGVKIGWLNKAFAEGVNSRSARIIFDMHKLRTFASSLGVNRSTSQVIPSQLDRY